MPALLQNKQTIYYSHIYFAMKRFFGTVLTLVACWIMAHAGQPDYTNPILPYDYSDPDVIRVGKNYYMTYSTFACVPGLQILHSVDGVRWQIVDAALPDTVPGYGHLDACPAGCGVWAPSIRHHKGRFYIYYGDPDIGIFCIRSEKTRTIPCRWEPAVLVKRGKGLIDPCPLWDSDGRCYLVHAFAGSRAGFKSALAVCELAEDGLSVRREDQLVFDGHPDNPTCEGPKFHKRNGYYYILCPAGGVKTGWQLCLRSRSVYGPYEWKRVLEQGATAVNAPHQGAWVDDMFYHFQDVGTAGRIVHLQPLEWQDNWPVIGNNGEPVPGMGQTGTGMPSLYTMDGFWTRTLSPEWQWSGNRKAQYYYLASETDSASHMTNDYLRLFTFPAGEPQTAPNLLLRKIPANTAFTATAKVRFMPRPQGKNPKYTEEAGLIIHGRQSRTMPVPADGQWYYVRIEVSDTHLCRFFLSSDNQNWNEQGAPFQAVAGEWIGAKIGLYAVRSVVQSPSPYKRPDNDAGYLDIDWFELR